MDPTMLHHLIGALLTLTLGAGPRSDPELAHGECASDEYRLVDTVVLPHGGEVQTVASENSLEVNFYIDGALVLTARDRDGEPAGELTEYGSRLPPERAVEFLSDLDAALPLLMTGERCSTGDLRTKVDEKFKCGLVGVGVGLLTNFFCPGPCAAAAGATTKLVCDYIVDKACEKNSEGC